MAAKKLMVTPVKQLPGMQVIHLLIGACNVLGMHCNRIFGVHMRKRIFDFIFVAVSLMLVMYTARKPIYNWDMIAYMGVVEEYSEHNIQKVHDIVYYTLQKEVPTDVYSGLTNDKDDRRQCLVDANVFYQELSFFRAKPLYTGLVFLLHKLGCPFVLSTLIPSIISSFFFLLICYIWLCTYLKKEIAAIFALLLAQLPIFSELIRYSTPDALSNVLLLLSLYLIATDKKKHWLILALLLSLFARIDNFIFVFAALFFVYLKDVRKRRYPLLAGIAIAGAGVFIIPMLFGNSFDWFTKFAFLFSVSDYAAHWKAVLFDLRQPLYILLIIISYFLLKSDDRKTTLIVKIILSTLAIRLVLFPSVQERFFAAYEFAIAILFIGYMSSRYKTKSAETMAFRQI